MSNGFIYVVDAHFIDKIEKKKEKKSWTQNQSYNICRYGDSGLNLTDTDQHLLL
jgi:hypothetical protein